MASKAIQHSDADLWNSHKEITEFNEVIDLIMQGRTKNGNLNKIAEVKFAETTTQSEEFISLIQQSSEMLTKSFLVDLEIVCISDMLSSPHWNKNNQFKPTINSQQSNKIDKNSWWQPEPPVPDLSSSDSEPMSVLQKYSNIRLDKQSMTNTLNSDEDFLQSNHSITEAGLFEIYININFPPLGINMGTSGLSPVP